MRLAPIATATIVIGVVAIALAGRASGPIDEYVRDPVHPTTETEVAMMHAVTPRSTLIRWCATECPAPGR